MKEALLEEQNSICDFTWFPDTLHEYTRDSPAFLSTAPVKRFSRQPSLSEGDGSRTADSCLRTRNQDSRFSHGSALYGTGT
jgi:hypothetical protein